MITPYKSGLLAEAQEPVVDEEGWWDGSGLGNQENHSRGKYQRLRSHSIGRCDYVHPRVTKGVRTMGILIKCRYTYSSEISWALTGTVDDIVLVVDLRGFPRTDCDSDHRGTCTYVVSIRTGDWVCADGREC